MGSNHSPLDALAAFTLGFIAGVISTDPIVQYIERVHRESSVLRSHDDI
ncbi:MAG: hypothetical protein Q8K22_06915 [Rhodoferax sp.]|jgi:hypothetical protein|nr:hypothetical protein [Rhodoferax sp.]